jgi:hypothetical protein
LGFKRLSIDQFGFGRCFNGLTTRAAIAATPASG